ncbi:unnamed protein product [Blepharisma stoltei]|uniref:Uncharacterized protein n=1 Tax=Blepharisma stoltei TaxID=1481888 RepID=A0AAU9I5X3_9CILI|nr:unnamed protein product [Blepharisma stoltei]
MLGMLIEKSGQELNGISAIFPFMILGRVLLCVNQVSASSRMMTENLCIFYSFIFYFECANIIWIYHLFLENKSKWFLSFVCIPIFCELQIYLFIFLSQKDQISPVTFISIIALSWISYWIVALFMFVTSKLVDDKSIQFLTYLVLIIIQSLYNNYTAWYFEWFIMRCVFWIYEAICLSSFIYFSSYLIIKYLSKFTTSNKNLKYFDSLISKFLEEEEMGYIKLACWSLFFCVEYNVIYRIIANWPSWMTTELILFSTSVSFGWLLFLRETFDLKNYETHYVLNIFACYTQIQMIYNFFWIFRMFLNE